MEKDEKMSEISDFFVVIKKETPRLASPFLSIIIFTILNRFQLTIYLFHDIILSIL